MQLAKVCGYKKAPSPSPVNTQYLTYNESVLCAGNCSKLPLVTRFYITSFCSYHNPMG